MSEQLAFATLILGGYLIGSVPFAVLSSRLLGLPDPRSYGSGNPGATNVLRSGSKLAAALTLVGDSVKGACAVWLAQSLSQHLGLGPVGAAVAGSAAGAAAFLGHVFPVFLRFRGGKGVATFLGVVLAVNWLVGLAVCLAWVLVALLWRYSSLASMVSACCAPLVFALAGDVPGVAAVLAAMAAVLVWRHRQNLISLRSGSERKIALKRSRSVDSAG